MPDGVRIGELARLTGSTPRALRHYERHGLIAPSRADNGYRFYERNVTIRVRNIRHLLAAGLTLEDVRAFLPCLDGDVTTATPSTAGLRVGLERLAVLDARIEAQRSVRARLARALGVSSGPGPAEHDAPLP